MKTKKEVLAKEYEARYPSQQYEESQLRYTFWPVVDKAMEEYAKQEAIEFAEWMQRYSLYDYSKHPYKYIVRQQPSCGRSKPEQFTAAQIFELYKQQKQI